MLPQKGFLPFVKKTRKDPAEPRLLAIFHAMLSFANCIKARELAKQFFYSLPLGPSQLVVTQYLFTTNSYLLPSYCEKRNTKQRYIGDNYQNQLIKVFRIISILAVGMHTRLLPSYCQKCNFMITTNKEITLF